MMLLNRLNFFQPQAFNVASSGIWGTTQKVTIDRSWPLEEIVLIVNAKLNSTALTKTAATTVNLLDGIAGAIKRVNLSVNDPIAGRPRTVVDFSGAGLLEYAQLTGLNLDTATLEAIRTHNTTAGIAASSQIQITYRIPLVHPLIADPLRTRMLLPVHLYQQDPVLTVDFASSASGTEIGTGGSPLFDTAVSSSCELLLLRRNISASLDAQIQKTGGYIESDLLEFPFTFGVGVSGEQRVPLNLPGYYLNVLQRQYLGGTNFTRAEIDQTTTLGSESRWRLETGGSVIREWRWKHLRKINEWSQPRAGLNSTITFVAPTSAGSPTVALNPGFFPGSGAATSTNLYFPAATTMLDFLTDGLDSANELGSVLDCYTPASRGLKMEIIGPIASVSSNSSVLYVGGHRITSPDISQWQAVR
jgi:hypothetical protein